MYREMESPSKREVGANPMKKRLLQNWDSKPATQPNHVTSQPNTTQPVSSSVPAPLPNSLSPNHQAPSKQTVTTTVKSTDQHTPQRRRYPKLLLTSENGTLIANPLNLPRLTKPNLPTIINSTTGLAPPLPSSKQLQAPNGPPPRHQMLQEPNTATNSETKRVQPPTHVHQYASQSMHTLPALPSPNTHSATTGANRVTAASHFTSNPPYHPLPVFSNGAHAPRSAAPRNHVSDSIVARDASCAYEQQKKLAEPPSHRTVSRSDIWTSSQHDTLGPQQTSIGLLWKPNGSQALPLARSNGDMLYQSSTPSMVTGGANCAKATSPFSGPPVGDAHKEIDGLQLLPTSPLSAGERARETQNGRVIQAGHRSGTVQYWRSSLQMPKTNGVQKPVPKKTVRIEKGPLKVPVESQTNMPADNATALAPGETTNPPSVSPVGISNSSTIPTNRGLANPHATRAPLDTGQVHSYWRNSTKLPSVSSDKARMKRRLAQTAINDRTLPPISESAAQPNSSNDAEGVSHGEKIILNRTEETARVDTASHSHAAVSSSQILSTRLVPRGMRINAVEKFSAVGLTPQMVIDEEQVDIRRLHMTKDYEIRKLEAYAESRYHVKMNLRGRNKLERWLTNTDRVAANSVMFIVLVLNLDRRLVSRSPRERQDALEEMDNEHLRMLEALMARTSTRDGHTNWALLTENFSPEQVATG